MRKIAWLVWSCVVGALLIGPSRIVSAAEAAVPAAAEAAVPAASVAANPGEKAAPVPAKPQTACPIDGAAVDKKVFVDFQGQRIYFCKHECAAAFGADAEAFMKKVEEQGVLLENVQKSCPMCGMDLEKTVFADYKGLHLFFCSKECREEFLKNPETYLKTMDQQAGERTFGCGVNRPM